jgi:hypothetical protein
MNIRSLLTKSSSECAWHAAHCVSACCAVIVKHYAFLIYRRLAVQVSMEVKSGHTKESGVSAFVPIQQNYFGCHKPQISR